MGVRRKISTLMLSALLLSACTQTPHDAIGDRIVDGVRTQEESEGARILDRFYSSTGSFDQAIGAFSDFPGDRPDALVQGDRLLDELSAAYEDWSVSVDEVVALDPDGLPRDELLDWREAAGVWIAKQKAITSDMLRCGDNVNCMRAAQSEHSDDVYDATATAQSTKRRLVEATED